MLGAERVVLELAKQTSQFGYQSIIGSISDVTAADKEFIQMGRAQQTEVHSFFCSGRFDVSMIFQLREFVSKARIDLIHCHGYKEDFYVRFAFLPIPKVATNHLWKNTSRALRWYSFIDAVVLRSFDRVITVSSPIFDKMTELGINPERLAKIPNGIDCTRYSMVGMSVQRQALLSQLSIPKNAKVLGMVSSLTIEKGHSYALEAFRRIKLQCPDLILLIVGDGNLWDVLQEQVKRDGLLGDVFFTGSRRDIPEILQIIDIFLLASLDEGMPMAVLEAMASGKAIVGTKVGEMPQMIVHGQCGVLVPPADVVELEKAIMSLLINEDYRQKIGKAAQEMVTKNFSSKVMAQRYCTLYDELLE